MRGKNRHRHRKCMIKNNKTKKEEELRTRNGNVEKNTRRPLHVYAYRLFDFGSDAVLEKDDFALDELGEGGGHGREGVLGVGLAVGAAQVAHQHHALGAILHTNKASGACVCVRDNTRKEMRLKG